VGPARLQQAVWVAGSVALSAIVLQRVKALGLLSHHPASAAANALSVLVGSLLASSCCVVQLVLNALSLGCAGFAALDRFRPFFLSTTLGTLLLRAHLEHRAGVLAPRPLSWTAALVLSFLPEILRWRNQLALRQRSISDEAAAAAEAPKDARAAAAPRTVTLEAVVAGVKCEGCAAGLREALFELPPPAATDSSSSGGGVSVASSAVAWHSTDASTVAVTVVGDAPAEALEAAARAALDRACASRSYTYALVAPPGPATASASASPLP
jgi:copper chaperone CopZ